MQSRGLRRILHIRDGDRSGPPGFGDEDPDQAPVIKIGQGVDEEIRKILLLGVIGAPPHDGAVHHVPVIGIDELRAGLLLDERAKALIGVIVDVELLHDLSRCESEAHRHDEQPPFGKSAWRAAVSNTRSS